MEIVKERNDEKTLSQKIFEVAWQCYVAETLQLYWGIFLLKNDE